MALNTEHDPSGRLCALAGRMAAGHVVTDYCEACYADILREQETAALVAELSAGAALIFEDDPTIQHEAPTL
jgi:hypothetical protein